MAFVNPTTPNLADFTTFVYEQGVPQVDLPSNSVYLTWALTYAENIALIPPGDMPSIIYVLAVYNLGMHHLLMIAQDVSGQTFFQAQRTAFMLLSFVAGPVSASGDQGTNQTLLVADWMKNMTLSSLDLLKTPWGRSYIQYAQSYGPNIIGVS
jgi:hypothetical protein